MKPIAGTDTCQHRHVGYMVSGHMKVKTAEGGEQHIHAGEAYVIEPGHDAWTVGNEPTTAIEFSSVSAEEFAARKKP